MQKFVGYTYREMGLSESALKPFQLFKVIVKYHVIVHVALRYVEKITIVMLILIHMHMLTAIAKKNIQKQNNTYCDTFCSMYVIIISSFFCLSGACGGAGGGAGTMGSDERTIGSLIPAKCRHHTHMMPPSYPYDAAIIPL